MIKISTKKEKRINDNRQKINSKQEKKQRKTLEIKFLNEDSIELLFF